MKRRGLQGIIGCRFGAPLTLRLPRFGSGGGGGVRGSGARASSAISPCYAARARLSLTPPAPRIRMRLDPAQVQTMRIIRRTALAVIGLTLFAPAAFAAKPKLYSVSLTGSVRSDLTSTRDLPPPGGCVGSASETQHFTASGSLSPRPGAAPVASYSRLIFKARLGSPAASYTRRHVRWLQRRPERAVPARPERLLIHPRAQDAQLQAPLRRHAPVRRRVRAAAEQGEVPALLQPRRGGRGLR